MDIEIDGIVFEGDPEEAAAVDAAVALAEGLDPEDDPYDPVEVIIGVLGRDWVCRIAKAPDTSDASFEQFGRPWLVRYRKAFLTFLGREEK